MSRLSVGDTIECHDNEELIDIMTALAKEGIETDFLYERNGEKGFWLEITQVKGA